jgi:anti-anti-sigma factor
MASGFSISLSDGSDTVTKVVALTGELDETNMDDLRDRITPVLTDLNIKTVIFHLKDLSFINSKGIGYLVSVHTHLAKNQRRLIMAEAQEPVMDVVSLVGLTTIIPYFATLEEAIASLGA